MTTFLHYCNYCIKHLKNLVFKHWTSYKAMGQLKLTKNIYKILKQILTNLLKLMLIAKIKDSREESKLMLIKALLVEAITWDSADFRDLEVKMQKVMKRMEVYKE